jgi:Flp pilus assembly protein TadD
VSQQSNVQIQQQLQLAYVSYQDGQFDRAWALIEPHRIPLGHLPKVQMLIGMICTARGQTADALAAYGLALKHSPADPEIINAHANALVAAGDPVNGLAQFDRLAASFPKLLDGHINRAILANELGDWSASIIAANFGLRFFPDNARLLGILALALKAGGRIDDGLAAFRLSIVREPDRALTRYNYAVTLLAAGKADEACAEFEQAVRLGRNDDTVFACWAEAELERANVQQSIRLYEHILQAVPNHDIAAQAIGRIHAEYDTGADPFAHYAAAANSAPDQELGWLKWLNALLNFKRYDLIPQVAEQAERASPGNYRASALACFARGMLGDGSNAQLEFRALSDLISNRNDADNFRPFLIQLALKGRMPQQAATYAEAILANRPSDQAALAYLSTAWRMLGDDREFWLCDYERFIIPIDVECAALELDSRDFARHLAPVLDRLHRADHAPGNQSLSGGTQSSGALFARHDRDIALFQDAARTCVGAALAEFPADNQHPFLNRRSGNLEFAGSWSVRLRQSGKHDSHFHSEGWISSAYYCRLPENVCNGAVNGDNQGAIEFGSPPELLGLDLEPRRIIQPVAGQLILFPSYMWHGTIPFSGDETRLTAAFDIVPT